MDCSAAPVILSSAALVVALGALAINAREHREFMRQLRARAKFDVTVRTVDGDEDGIRWTDARTTTQGTTIAIGVKNVGDKAASETLVNVVVPEKLDWAQWVGSDGRELPDGPRTAKTGEMLPDRNGEETIPSKYLSSTWSRLGTRPHYEKYVKIPVDMPPPESGLSEQTVPIRVRVQADELPDEIDEYVIDYAVRVVRRRG